MVRVGASGSFQSVSGQR